LRVLFYIHHPAQFHLFKNAIAGLKATDSIKVVATKKDILLDLLDDFGIDYINILPEGRKDNYVSIALGLLKQDYRLWNICRSWKPGLLVGTSTEITHVGRLLGIDSIFVNEDDVEIVPLVGVLAYPFAKWILAPEVCSVGRWQKKKLSYQGNHELAYLHPSNFNPDAEVASRYVDIQNDYFILRFAKLGAHHDHGRQGISDELATMLVQRLTLKGRVLITSERPLPPALEKYRVSVAPLDMHHVMAFASGYIGDSQTMAAEAGVLGVPFIRYNDFVGQIGYLNELEVTYTIGRGLRTGNEEELLSMVEKFFTPAQSQISRNKRDQFIGDKLDVAKLIIETITDYPRSLERFGKL
jgi:uncharacterized protein